VEFNFNRIGTFTVTGSAATRDVRIFPRPSCSCPETTTCYHVMAVRLACGLGTKDARKLPNVTRLRKNGKKKTDKTSGRKRPRTKDVDGWLWQDLNGDRCGSDPYDSSYDRSPKKEAKDNQHDKQTHKTYLQQIKKSTFNKIQVKDPDLAQSSVPAPSTVLLSAAVPSVPPLPSPSSVRLLSPVPTASQVRSVSPLPSPSLVQSASTVPSTSLDRSPLPLPSPSSVGSVSPVPSASQIQLASPTPSLSCETKANSHTAEGSHPKPRVNY
jgi:hypothetical protein